MRGPCPANKNSATKLGSSSLSSRFLQLRTWRGRRSALSALETERAQVAVEDLTGDALREHVRRVLVAPHLEQGEVAAAQALLDPQLADSQVAYAANAAPAADAYRRCGIRAHADGHGEAEVLSPRLDAQRVCRALHKAVKLSFGRAQRHRALRARSVLDQVGAAEGYPT